MDFSLLDKNFRRIGILDDFDSAIWTERFYTHGDFELRFPLTNRTINDLPKDYYVELDGSDELMIIEHHETLVDEDKGAQIQVKGRSLTSLLERRLIWSNTVITGALIAAVKKLLDENALVTSSNAPRRFTNMVWQAPGATVPTNKTVDAKYQGENLYESLNKLLKQHNLGLRVRKNSEYKFVVDIYGGVDYSYNQTVRPYLVFSPEFDNLDQMRYISSRENYGNVALVGGEGDGADKKRVDVYRTNPQPADLARYEFWVDGKATSDNGAVPAATYLNMLRQEGREAMKKHNEKTIVDGSTDPAINTGYGHDYILGDMVQVSDSVQLNGACRVVEYIRSQDDNGYQAYPSFAVDDEEIV